MIATGANTVWNAINSVSIGNVNRKVNIATKNLSYLNERVDTLDISVRGVKNEVCGNGYTPSLLDRAIQGSVNKAAALTQQAFMNTMGVDPWYYQTQQPQQQGVKPQEVVPRVQVPQGVAPVTNNVTVAPPQSQQQQQPQPLTEEVVKAMITQIIADMNAAAQQPQSTNNNKK